MKLEARTLENAFVRLEPLAAAHREGLRAAAADPAIWRWIPFPVVRDGYDAYFDTQSVEWRTIGAITFTVFAPSGQAVGQTSYLNPRAKDCGVEVGGTWYAPSVWAGAINPACKLLLLGHAFACGAERVELKTNANNARSRAAIAKLGASFEGVHRHHMKLADGSWRDTAWYSLLSAEWPAAKAKLEARLSALR